MNHSLICPFLFFQQHRWMFHNDTFSKCVFCICLIKCILVLLCQSPDQRSNLSLFLPNWKKKSSKKGFCLLKLDFRYSFYPQPSVFSRFNIPIDWILFSFVLAVHKRALGGGRRASWLILQREESQVVLRSGVGLWKTGWHWPCLQPKLHTLKILFTETAKKFDDLLTEAFHTDADEIFSGVCTGA